MEWVFLFMLLSIGFCIKAYRIALLVLFFCVSLIDIYRNYNWQPNCLARCDPWCSTEVHQRSLQGPLCSEARWPGVNFGYKDLRSNDHFQPIESARARFLVSFFELSHTRPSQTFRQYVNHQEVVTTIVAVCCCWNAATQRGPGKSIQTRYTPVDLAANSENNCGKNRFWHPVVAPKNPQDDMCATLVLRNNECRTLNARPRWCISGSALHAVKTCWWRTDLKSAVR